MAEIISTELKDDLATIYKHTGDLLTMLQARDFDNERKEIRDILELIKFRLEDMEGTLQKDIYNCDYLITKYKTRQMS